MPTDEFQHLRNQKKSNDYNFKKIRNLLSSDILRFCKDDKIVKALQNRTHSSSTLNDLRTIVAGLKYGKDTVYAAIVLSLFNDPQGTMILKNYQK